jgi:hypothetical protein
MKVSLKLYLFHYYRFPFYVSNRIVLLYLMLHFIFRNLNKASNLLLLAFNGQVVRLIQLNLISYLRHNTLQ